MHFTFTQGTGDSGVIRGVDKHGVEGEQIVYTGDWQEYQQATSCSDKGNKMDEAIKEFFGPLFEKLDEVCEEQDEDPLHSVRVIREEVEATPGKPGVAVDLCHDGVRILAVVEGHWDRLSWVNERLFVEAPSQPAKGSGSPF